MDQIKHIKMIMETIDENPDSNKYSRVRRKAKQILNELEKPKSNRRKLLLMYMGLDKMIR